MSYNDVEEIPANMEDCEVSCKQCSNPIKDIIIVSPSGDFCGYKCLTEYRACEAEYFFDTL